MAIRKLSELGAEQKKEPSKSPRIPALDLIHGAGNTVDRTFIPVIRLEASYDG